MEVLCIIKIMLNMGFGEVIVDKKIIENVVGDFMKIVGQKLVVMKVCKVIVGFKICQGYLIGVMVMLCGCVMYEFFDCFVMVVLFCVCDFCGVLGCVFDGCGNYNIGVKEQIIFFEIDYDKIDVLCGLNISIMMIVKIDDEVKVLFVSFKFLFRN